MSKRSHFLCIWNSYQKQKNSQYRIIIIIKNTNNYILMIKFNTCQKLKIKIFSQWQTTKKLL